MFFSFILDSSAIKYDGAYFGEGQGEILMDNVDCSGKENDIAECSFSGWGNHNCGHSKDVSVKCNKRKILSCCGRLFILVNLECYLNTVTVQISQ